ncbi:MAG: DUF971 domain-containing protein, partial [Rhizobiaceae bacterium]|nr:DUF971 domain-containing protein [Rhizobiaceae bacterium]
MLTELALAKGGKSLELRWSDGQSARFHAMWLRDNALDEATRSKGNGQRLITILDIPEDTVIEDAALSEGDLSVRFAPESKAVRFPSAWLRRNAYDRNGAHALGWTGAEVTRWKKNDLQGAVPRASLAEASRDPATLRGWLAAV